MQTASVAAGAHPGPKGNPERRARAGLVRQDQDLLLQHHGQDAAVLEGLQAEQHWVRLQQEARQEDKFGC